MTGGSKSYIDDVSVLMGEEWVGEQSTKCDFDIELGGMPRRNSFRLPIELDM